MTNFEKANKLHNTLLEELRNSGYDPFLDRNSGADQLLDSAVQRVAEQNEYRKNVKGPSSVRERFTSKYWRNWNTEKNLLEDISYLNVTQQQSPRNIKKLLPLKKKASTKPTSIKGPTIAPLRNKGKGEFFDYHLLGNTDVEYLISAGLRQKIPRDERERHSPSFMINVTEKDSIIGGCLSNAKRDQVFRSANLTSNCQYPPMLTLTQANKGRAFSTVPRFKADKPSIVSGQVNIEASKTNGEAHQFEKADRFGDNKTKNSVIISVPISTDNIGTLAATEENSPHLICLNGEETNTKQQEGYVQFEYFPNDTPGPAHYELPRLFEEKKMKGKQDKFDAIVEKYAADGPGMSGFDSYKLAHVSVFGQGCNRQEHVLYGMCLDGQCCRRGLREQFAVRRNDLRLLAGYGAVETMGRNKEKLVGEMEYSTVMREALPNAHYAVDALYAAAYTGDAKAIHSLALVPGNIATGGTGMGVDPNITHPESGYTALHVAVFRCKVSSVQQLLHSFQGRIRLDKQDKQGDTALHLASRLGFSDIASVICDDPTCDPCCKKNNKGEYAIDIAKTHRVFQIIKICQERNTLQEEYSRLKEL